jgi:hypothetical protein
MLPSAPGLRSRSFRHSPAPCIGLLLVVLCVQPSWAAVDIFDRGPALVAGKFNLRVTNAGLVGNPFPDLSYDPSFEYPKGSGQELLRCAALWVGALGADGVRRVSGGPLLEFRPTLAPADTVRQAWHGRFGSRRAEDDDGDGVIDEDPFNDRDDDGDGEIDEDFGMVGQQMLVAEYTDDQPEAIHYQQAGGESHRPLGLTVHQEAYAWAWPGYDGIAGLQYTITNHSGGMLRDVYVGLYVDLDSRPRGDPAGHLNDAIGRVSFSRSFFKGITRVKAAPPTPLTFTCFDEAAGTVPFVDEPPGSGSPDMPVVAVLPLGHTTDPMVFLGTQYARAPGRHGFRSAVFAGDRAFSAGAPPTLDEQRYAAMKGEWLESPESHVGDQQILVSCGPFPTLASGQSLDFAVALVAAISPESLQVALGNAAFLYNGTELNLLPDDTGPEANWWSTGETGVNGHEACIEAPHGVEVVREPHCPGKFGDIADPGLSPELYRHGTCVWTDADCDVCTGMNGRETVVRWANLQNVPPSPSHRVIPGDHSVRIEWDNLPEVLVKAGKVGPPGGTFIGYRLHRLEDWRDRGSLMPRRERWASLATYGFDTTDSKVLISTITDSTLDYTRIWYEQKHYPVGRYVVTDPQPKNGFDYLYLVTSVVETRTPFQGFVRVDRYESPLVVSFEERAVPRAEARGDANGVWVVPNPFRAAADWDRPQVYGDRLTRHLDFMGLPRARCTIRIWTVAGDHVATLDHDGTRGSGQAAWDLVSRNGQEVASGIYLYTVESSLGTARGRFVVIR